MHKGLPQVVSVLLEFAPSIFFKQIHTHPEIIQEIVNAIESRDVESRYTISDDSLCKMFAEVNNVKNCRGLIEAFLREIVDRRRLHLVEGHKNHMQRAVKILFKSSFENDHFTLLVANCLLEFDSQELKNVKVEYLRSFRKRLLEEGNCRMTMIALATTKVDLANQIDKDFMVKVFGMSPDSIPKLAQSLNLSSQGMICPQQLKRVLLEHNFATKGCLGLALSIGKIEEVDVQFCQATLNAINEELGENEEMLLREKLRLFKVLAVFMNCDFKFQFDWSKEFNRLHEKTTLKKEPDDSRKYLTKGLRKLRYECKCRLFETSLELGAFLHSFLPSCL